MTIPLERQNEVQDLAGPILDEFLARLVACGIRPHEAGQLLVLQGAGLLAGSLGPRRAGYALGEVAEGVSGWIHKIAADYEKRDTHC